MQAVSRPYHSWSDLVEECSLPLSLVKKSKGAKDPDIILVRIIDSKLHILKVFNLISFEICIQTHETITTINLTHPKALKLLSASL